MLGTSKTRYPVNVGTSVRKIWVLFVCFLRLHEFDEQVAAVREGMARVVPVPLLSLFTGYELETMVRAALCCLNLLGTLAHSLFDPLLKPLHLESHDLTMTVNERKTQYAPFTACPLGTKVQGGALVLLGL